MVWRLTDLTRASSNPSPQTYFRDYYSTPSYCSVMELSVDVRIMYADPIATIPNRLTKVSTMNMPAVPNREAVRLQPCNPSSVIITT